MRYVFDIRKGVFMAEYLPLPANMNTDYEKLLQLMREYGMDYKWARMFVKKLADDEQAFQTDEKTKRWALERGFYPGRVELYGLTEENYQSYLSDFGYFMIHPLNHHFKIWINDKLTLKYVLNSSGCELSMPEYYLYVENNGDYTYLMDAPKNIDKDKNFLINLLREKKYLAVKPNSGTSGGRGFMKWEWDNGNIIVNNKPISIEEFEEISQQLQNHIVTEYAHEHEDLAKIWSESECTLRVIMAKLPQKIHEDSVKWHCTVSYARFGSSVSGGASNLSSGGIGIGFDFETGKFNETGIRYKRFCPDGQYICTEHPDTRAVWKECRLPNWHYVREMILKVCQHISSLDYLGLDIIITQDGMKFCEINSHPACDYEQIMCGPILRNEDARAFFDKHGLYKIKCADFWEMYQASQR